MPTNQADSLPLIRLISFESACVPQPLPAPPQDLRFLRVEEFLKARSLSANSQKAYHREPTRFLEWTDRSLADIIPRQIAQFTFHLLEQGLTATSGQGNRQRLAAWGMNVELNQIRKRNVSDLAMKMLAKWSVDEYHCMVEAGILCDRRVELLAGEIIEMSPETPSHYNTAKRGAKYLEELLAGRADIRFNGPITLLNSEPEPDIAIVQLPESTYNRRHPEPEDIFCLIEVAKTSLKKNLDFKTSIYATAEIQEYWVLDLSGKQVIVFREPQNGQFTRKQIIGSGEIIPLAFPGVRVLVERLFN